jgi:hypothetical protein
MVFQSPPSFFYTLFNDETIPGSLIYNRNKSIKVYLVPMFIVAVANGLPKLYSILLKHKLFPSEQERFAFSLEAALTFPFLIALLISFQFTSRINRLVYYDPILLTFSCNVMPILIIKNNKAMLQRLKDTFGKPNGGNGQRWFCFWKKNNSISILV